LYSAVEAIGGVAANVRLSLATATDPTSIDGWTRHGAIFPDVDGHQWTKSGALLIRDDEEGPHYLFWGDSSQVLGLQVECPNKPFADKYLCLS